ncbi:hypothetical protein TcWFU_010197 [Taenia crassiceps]|uniref:Uncharacterized protein n=1 Tax=Taenia crassiceps TaxID=6207 RepID=A0ABR4QNR0_9CEST
MEKMLPTILEGRNNHNLRTVPEEKTSDVSSDVDDNDAAQLIHRTDNGKENLLNVEPSPSSGAKDENKIAEAKSPISLLREHQRSQSPSSPVNNLPLGSDFHSTPEAEEKNSKNQILTPTEPKVSTPRSRSPSPSATSPDNGNYFNLSTLKEVEEPRAPSLVITQAHKSRSPSPIATKPQNDHEYHALPLKESVGSDRGVVHSVHMSSKYHSDEESSRSSSLAENNMEERPDPIGGVETVPSQQYEEEKAKTNVMETEEATSEDSNSTDYSLDSARGDSLLPTVDENFFSGSRVQPRLLLMKPSEGSSAGDYEVCLYGVHLDEEVMLHAEVFIDVYNVSRENWQVVSGQWPSLAPDATHCLRIQVPSMPPGEAWIEHSMRGMGGQVNRASPPTMHQPAPSFADFEFSPKKKAAKANAKNLESIESAKLEISKLYSEITRLKVELQAKSADEVRVARELCMLRTRLLEDGQLKYLERN